ncbi:MAG: M28 family peptidase [Acidobacteria bacterium]|nr:M28 family peptidase [Acidobacteriota bacterium]
MRRRDLILAAMAPSAELRLKEIAAVHTAIAERDQRNKVWGRIGGSPAEHASATALREQLSRILPQVALEEFEFQAHRSADWAVRADGMPLETAMPAPFEARFPEGERTAKLEPVAPDGDWARTKDKWAFVQSNLTTSTAFNIVREKLLYQKAVTAGAAGLLFALPTPATSRWKSVVPVDKPYAVKDERYAGGLRPIPCFSMDRVDGARVAKAGSVTAKIRYAAKDSHRGRNVVGFLPGATEEAAGIMCHIDSFFTGAIDNASGIAAMVGIAEPLARLPRAVRRCGFYFLGLSAHHDEAAGMRDWVARDPQRFARIKELFLLEHVDAIDSEEGRTAGWPMPLNNQRTAYLGSEGWPEVRALLPDLVRRSGVMTVDPKMQNACIADLFVTCGRVKSFCLMNAPPYYHTDHDTIERIGESGIRNAVAFHTMLFSQLGLTKT